MQDPFSGRMPNTPYEIYRQLRSEAPVYWSSTMRAWVLTRMDHIKAVLDDDAYESVAVADNIREIARRSGRAYHNIARFLDATLFFKNGDIHARDRRTLVRVINRTSLSKLRGEATQIAADLAAALEGQDSFDLIASFASPLPQRVMALILGFTDLDVSRLSDLLSDITLVFDPALLDVYDRVERQVSMAYDLIAERILSVKDGSEAVGLKLIYEAMPGHADERLDLAVAMALFTYRVGAETTIGLIGLIARAMMDDPVIRDRLEADRSLIEPFVMEVLRMESNVQRSIRVARAPGAIGGQAIKAGDRIILLLGAANRDPEAIPTPDRISLEQPGAGDVAFGYGPHYCLGAALAKMEGVIAVEMLLRLGPLQPDGEETWFQGSTIRRLTKLPVRRDRVLSWRGHADHAV